MRLSPIAHALLLAWPSLIALAVASPLAAVAAPLATARQAPATAPPALLLARTYRSAAGLDLAAYWLSEKFDGVRGYWDGQRLRTRNGTPIAAPAWFTAGWPDIPLDGELWLGRGAFERTVATVRQAVPVEADWRRLRYQVFDLPAQPGPFTARLAVLAEVVAAIDRPWVTVVAQERLTADVDLDARLAAVVAGGGEGLVLHRGDAPYRPGRSDDLLKLKPHDDAEAKVVAHLPGRGRLQGRIGALLVQTPEGRRFRLGAGLSEAGRNDPPPPGAWVTYRYSGLTAAGMPRFPRFLRSRGDWDATTER